MGSVTQEFADRGVYVGFRGRGLEAVRCRTAKNDDDVYEALIVNWSGDSSRGGDMIMPFDGLKNWRSLDEFDENLFLAVQEYGARSKGYMDPLVMRGLRLKTIVSHGNELEIEEAEASMDVEVRDVHETFLEVLALFSREYGNRIGDEELKHVTRHVLNHLMQDDSQAVYKLAKKLAGIMARLSGGSGDVLARRIEFYSEFSAPICSLVTGDTSRKLGYLSRQLGRLEKFASDLIRFGRSKTEETRMHVEKINENAQRFIDYALKKSTDIRNKILNNHAYTDPEQFKDMQQDLRINRLYISFALDGWDNLARRWELAKQDSAEACTLMIGEIFRTMPQPTKELSAAGGNSYDTTGMGMRTGSVKEMHSWDNEIRDEELFTRVQQGRQRGEETPGQARIRQEARKQARAESKKLLDNVLELVSEVKPDAPDT